MSVAGDHREPGRLRLWFGSGAVIVALLGAGATLSDAAPNSTTGLSPNNAVGWIATSTEFFQPVSGAGPVSQDPAHPHVSNEEYRATGRQPTLQIADLSNPILQPWVKEELRKRNELVLTGEGDLSPAVNCWPVGVPSFLLLTIQPIFFVPGPKEVVLVWQGDHHQMRRVYLTDRHSPHVNPSWFGESIGHYEGDTLVVDTIGFNTRTVTDFFFTPHTDKLHVVERFRVFPDGRTMEASIHVEDPGAFTMGWDAVQRYRRVEPGVAENETPLSPISGSTAAGPLIERICAENAQNHFGGGIAPVPQAEKSDF
jgi:hypothetical protein